MKTKGGYIVVIPPRRFTGLRHYADPVDKSGRTLCGRNADGWKVDIKGDDRQGAGCTQCAVIAWRRSKP